MKKYLVPMLILLASACTTTPEDIPQDLDKSLYFKEAQEAVDELNWERARTYLGEFKNRYPQDRADILAADYLLAVIEYKQGFRQIALEGFMAIIDVYEDDTSGMLHEWVEVLSSDFIERLSEP